MIRHATIWTLSVCVLAGLATAGETGVDVWTNNGGWTKTATLGTGTYVEVEDTHFNRDFSNPSTPVYYDAGFFARSSDLGIEHYFFKEGTWNSSTVTSSTDYTHISTDGTAAAVYHTNSSGDLLRSYSTDYTNFATWVADQSMVSGNGYTTVTGDKRNVNWSHAAGPDGLDFIFWSGYWGVAHVSDEAYYLVESDRYQFRDIWCVSNDGLDLVEYDYTGAGNHHIVFQSDDPYIDLAPEYEKQATFALLDGGAGVDYFYYDPNWHHDGYYQQGFTDIAADPDGEAFYGINGSGLWKVTWNGIGDWSEELISSESYAGLTTDSVSGGIVYAFGEGEAVVYLLGDANGDGLVSADDYASVQANFGNTGVAGGGLLGDANQDGLVSADDYASVQANFGNTLAQPQQVPEPASLGLLTAGFCVLLRRRRKRN